MEKMNKMDKKGIVLTLGMIIVIAILALLVLGGLVFFISANVWLIVGAGIITLAFIFGVPAALQGDFDTIKMAFLIITLLLGVFVIAVPYIGLVENQQLQSGYFEAPFFATISCEPNQQGREDSASIDVRQTGGFVQCPENSVDCDVFVEHPDLGLFDVERRLEYYMCDDRSFTNCLNPQYINDIEDKKDGARKKVVSNLPSNKVLYTEFQRRTLLVFTWKTDDETEGRIRLNFLPYVLKRQNSLTSGKTLIPGQKDCRVPTSDESWFERIISSTILDNSGKPADTSFETVGVKNQLKPNEAYNYISGTVTRAKVGNLVNYQGQEGYCIQPQGKTNQVIYALGRLETASNIYEIVDTNNLIAEVDCCEEGRSELGRICKNFKYEPIQIDDDGNSNIECSLLNPCPIGTLEYAEQKSFEWSCEQNICVQTNIQDVECTDNSHCLIGETCLLFECQEISTIPGGGDPEARNEQQAREQCEARGSRYQWVEKETESGFIFKEVSDESFCRDTWTPYLFIGGFLGVLILIFVAVIIFKPKKKKGIKK